MTRCPDCGRILYILYERITKDGKRNFEASGVLKCRSCGKVYLDKPGLSGELTVIAEKIEITDRQILIKLKR